MLKRREIMLITVLALASFGGTPTAHAATWHSGTPKAIRGHWIYHKSKLIFGYYYVRAHQIYFQNYQAIPYRERQVAYRNLGHGRYKLRYLFGYADTTYEQNIQYGWIVKRHGQLKVSGGQYPYRSRFEYHYQYHRRSAAGLKSRHIHLARPFS